MTTPKPVDEHAPRAARSSSNGAGGLIQLFTLGYEGLTPDRYFDIMQAAGAATLVDVRRTPQSRKPGLSKRRLSEAAPTRGLRYVHMVDLGTPRDILYSYRADHDHPQFLRRFAEYLNTQEAAVRELAALAEREPCCLMCVEADIKLCHRRIVAERVQQLIGRERCEVVHLSDQRD